MFDDKTKDTLFARCTFIPMRSSWGQERFEISFAQRNRWSNNLYRHWFYIRVSRVTFKDENGDDDYRYTLASKILISNPVTHVSEG